MGPTDRRPPKNAPPKANHWTVHLAIVATLTVLLDFQGAAWMQAALFGVAAILNSRGVERRLPKALRPLKLGYLLVSAPLFLFLTDPSRVEDEWRPTRAIYYLLLGCVYLLPFVPVGSIRDLRRVTVVLIACFFISATYFHCDYFIAALWLAAFALFAAFHAMDGRVQSRLSLRLAGVQLMFAVLCGGAVFSLFPRAWFRAPSDAGKFGSRDQTSQSLANSQQRSDVGASARRDLLQLPRMLDFSRSAAEVLRLHMTTHPWGTLFTATNSMYLRAALFETYANGNWISTPITTILRGDQGGLRDGWTRVRQNDGQAKRARIRQSIQMEPLDDVCFCLPDPLAINQSRIKYETRGILAFPYKTLRSRDYAVVSELPPTADSAELDEVESIDPTPELVPYLQMPPSLRLLMNRYKSRWNPASGPAGLARQIRRFLQSEYAYGPASYWPVEGGDPMRDFLTGSRRGYCTHFASAMALMARSMGIPSRIATGFHFVGPPDDNGLYHIRDRNAHAWTELYFPGHGWIVFDATPASDRPSVEAGSGSAGLWDFVGKLRQIHEFLADFDATDQKSILLRTGRSIAFAADWWRRVLSLPWVWLGALLGTLLAWAGFRALPLPHRRYVLQRLTGHAPASTVSFYEDLLWILGRHGLAKPATVTGGEHVEAIAKRFPSPDIDALTRQFYRVKYGGATLSAEELREVRRQLLAVERCLSRSR